MRLRLPEILTDHGETPWSAARKSGGRLQPSSLYRLAAKRGRVKNFDANLMEALCDVLGCTPGDLLERG